MNTEEQLELCRNALRKIAEVDDLIAASSGRDWARKVRMIALQAFQHTISRKEKPRNAGATAVPDEV